MSRGVVIRALAAITLLFVVGGAMWWWSEWSAKRFLKNAIAAGASGDCEGAISSVIAADRRFSNVNLGPGFNAIDFCLWKMMPSTDERLAMWQRFIDRFGSRNRAHAKTLLSSIYYERGDCEQARLTAEDAVRLDPQNAKAVAAVGAGHYCAKNWKSAREWYQKSLDINPNDAAVTHSLGAAFANDVSRESAPPDHVGRARELFRRSVSINPDFWKAHYSLAYFSSSPQGRDYAATLRHLEDFRRAWEKSGGWPPPKNRDVLFFYVESLSGDSFAGVGKAAEAREAYRRMFEIAERSGIASSPERFGLSREGVNVRLNRARLFMSQ